MVNGSRRRRDGFFLLITLVFGRRTQLDQRLAPIVAGQGNATVKTLTVAGQIVRLRRVSAFSDGAEARR